MLYIGSDKTPLYEKLHEEFLLIQDDKFKGTQFNPEKDGLDPLAAMNYRKARDFIEVLNAVFPEGENTLTRKNSNYIILKGLLDGKKWDDFETSDDPAAQDAHQKLQTLMLSPLLKKVFNTTPFNFRGRVVARLDRAKYGDFDCFVLAHFLISAYRGTVIIPDFGFYGRPYLSYLIREKRLICSVNSLAEREDMRHQLLLMEKQGRHTTFEDAKTLASYNGLIPNTNEYNDFIREMVA